MSSSSESIPHAQDPENIQKIAEKVMQVVASTNNNSDVAQTSTGSSSVNTKQESTMELSPEAVDFYAIGEWPEPYPGDKVKRLHTTFDCVAVNHFWEVLKKTQSYDVLEPSSDADLTVIDEKKVQRRLALLREMLKVDDSAFRRCFIHFFTSPSRRPEPAPWTWVRVSVKPRAEPTGGTGDVFADMFGGTDDFTLITRDAFDDTIRFAEVGLFQTISSQETKFLEEVFSLHHVPDAPFGGGALVPPTEPPPIIISDGGFSFELDDDFRSNGRNQGGSTTLPDETILPYPTDGVRALGKAFCRNTGETYLVEGVEGSEGFHVELRTEDQTRALSIVLQGETLVATVAYAHSNLTVVDEDDDNVTLRDKTTGMTFESPKKTTTVASSSEQPKRKPRRLVFDDERPTDSGTATTSKATASSSAPSSRQRKGSTAKTTFEVYVDDFTMSPKKPTTSTSSKPPQVSADPENVYKQANPRSLLVRKPLADLTNIQKK